MAPPIGVVLCGGASRRMGADKAAVEVDGVPMARRVADVLVAAGCSPVLAVGGDVTMLGGLGIEVVEDVFPGEGPLGGIVTALGVELRPRSWPATCPSFGRRRWRPCSPPSMATTRRLRSATAPEPLCAVWAASAAAVLRERFESGERAVHRALVGLDVAWVDVVPAELRNVNTPGDLRTP